MFVKLTLNGHRGAILINLDMVKAFSKNLDGGGGCWVDYAGNSTYRVAESLDEIQALISARITNP